MSRSVVQRAVRLQRFSVPERHRRARLEPLGQPSSRSSLPVSAARPPVHSKHADLRLRFRSCFNGLQEAYQIRQSTALERMGRRESQMASEAAKPVNRSGRKNLASDGPAGAGETFRIGANGGGLGIRNDGTPVGNPSSAFRFKLAWLSSETRDWRFKGLRQRVLPDVMNFCGRERDNKSLAVGRDLLSSPHALRVAAAGRAKLSHARSTSRSA